MTPRFFHRARRHGWLLIGLLTCLLPTRRSHAQAGSLDAGYVANSPKEIFGVVVQPDGKALVAGEFDIIDGVEHLAVARLNLDGSLDTGFVGTATALKCIALQSDGKVLVGGRPDNQYDGVATGSAVARLNADGTLDTGFNPGVIDGYVYALAQGPDGKVYLGGSFANVNGVLRRIIARLNTDGSLDTSFNADAISGNVFSIVVQPDGKVLVGGAYQGFHGLQRLGIARLNTDGSVDTSFAGIVSEANAAYNSTVNSVALQSDGKIVLGGSFMLADGVARNSIARLNADGTLDTSFTPNSEPVVNGLAIQPNGKVVMVGNFTQVNGAARGGIARLNADGSLDTGFDPGGDINGGIVHSVALQPDSKIVVVGNFTKVNGVTHNSVARFFGDTPAVPSPAITSTLSETAQVGQAFTYQITATNSPTSYAVTRLPGGLSVDTATGAISGTPTTAGTSTVALSATNAGGTGTAILTLVVVPALPTVSLMATTPTVTAGSGNLGVFTLNLSAAQDHDVFISFTIKGSAVNGSDYVLLKTTKKIKAGKTSKPIKITPLGEGAGTGVKRTVVLTLQPGDGYEVGTTGKVKVKIIGE